MNQQRLLDTFLEYVQIDSEMLHEKAFCDRLVQDLTALGAIITLDHAGAQLGSDTSNLFAWFDGDSTQEPILFDCHMDTVAPGCGIVPYLEDGIIRSRGETVLGADDKSGIAAIVEALRTIKEQKLAHRPVQLVFTIFEEGGVRGAACLDRSLLRAKQCVVFDCGGDVGKIVTGAPGHAKLRVQITGRAAHAGAAPEQGINAVQVGAAALSQMKLLRVDSETTANIGTFQAVGETNVVQAHAFLELEARSRDPQKLDEQLAHMVDCFKNACQQFGATFSYEIETSYQAYRLDIQTPLVQLVAGALRKAGIEPEFATAGGGSDANCYNSYGIPAVVVSTGMQKNHSSSEYITVKNLEDCTQLALALLCI